MLDLCVYGSDPREAGADDHPAQCGADDITPAGRDNIRVRGVNQ